MKAPELADKAKVEILVRIFPWLWGKSNFCCMHLSDCWPKFFAKTSLWLVSSQGKPFWIWSFDFHDCFYCRVVLSSWVRVSQPEEPHQLFHNTMSVQSKPEKLAKLLRERASMSWGVLWWGRVSAGQFPLPARGLDYRWVKSQQCLYPQVWLVNLCRWSSDDDRNLERPLMVACVLTELALPLSVAHQVKPKWIWCSQVGSPVLLWCRWAEWPLLTPALAEG